MIKTDVKELATHEYEVRVTVAQGEYDRVYADQMKRLSQQAKLPGFRPGKTPVNVIKKQFGPKLHEETVSELIQAHYVGSIESSGLTPAVQPLIDIPATQPSTGFEFTMKVAVWPEVTLADLHALSFDTTTVSVEDADVEQLIERLMKSQVSFEIEAERASEMGDQIHIDFVGSMDGEEFEGGKGEDVPLVLGEGRFIPGFEEQLLGKKAGEDATVEVSFPADYQAAHLAGKDAVFATKIVSVAKPNVAGDNDELAKLLNFDDGDALLADTRKRLHEEAKQASFGATRTAALDALIAANAMDLPEPLLAQEVQEATKRALADMQQRGMDAPESLLKDKEFGLEIRKRSERHLKLSILLQHVRERSELGVDDAELDVEIDRQSQQYPEEQRDQFKTWIISQKEQVEAMKDALLERKCIDYIVEQAQTTAMNETLSDWQDKQDQ